MLKRKIATTVVVICLMGLARVAMAENSSDQFRPFNGLFADLFEDGNKSQPQRPVQNHQNSNSPRMTQPQRVPTRAQPQAAPKVALQPTPQLDAGQPTAASASGIDRNSDALPSLPSTSDVRPRSSATSNNYSFQYDDSSSPIGPAMNPPSPSTSVGGDAATSSTVSAAPAGSALHERLKSFRQSPFAETPQTTPTPVNPLVVAAPAEPATSQPAETPLVAQRTPTAATPTTTTPSAEVLPSTPTAVEPERLATAKPANDAPGETPVLPAVQEPNVLINHKSPLLTVETIGPRKIVLGKEAAYEVLLQNSGNLAAEEVAVTVSLPDWAEVAGASASTGEVRPLERDRHDPCRWVLGRIEARSKEKLTLKIIPRQSKPFELAVRWDFKQAPSQAMIEVQEPKLTIRLDGPREVLFGKREVYKLKLGNSGNGAAENVLLTLMPLNTKDTHPTTHRLGTINSGDERAIEIELTARQAGNLTIRVEANGDGGVHVDLAEHVLVHRAALQVDLEGPVVQYVGTPANYKILIRNPGDALAKNVKLTAKLPTGMKFVSGSDKATSETAIEGGKVRWTLEQLPPGEQRVLEMKCMMALSGANRLEITSAADDDLVAAAELITKVEAMADLRLEVKDPEGPVPVGSDTTYELYVRNRGTKAAENVEVLAYFSTGVEPVSADGHPHHLSPGQVVFDLIPAIPPAAEIVLKVKIKAEAAGNHVFRAEVHCKALGTRLVREEVTHFYQDGPSLQQATAVPAKRTTSSVPPVTRDEPRTAERQPLPLPQSSGQPLPATTIKR
ncbi:MAG: hypothetical protein WCJ35_09070 [Planctomycetota bacterium]